MRSIDPPNCKTFICAIECVVRRVTSFSKRWVSEENGGVAVWVRRRRKRLPARD
jgi:hypothetical protein